MSRLIDAAVRRALRGTVTLAIASWVAAAQSNPKLVWLAPVLLALGKALRDKWPGKFEWLPV